MQTSTLHYRKLAVAVALGCAGVIALPAYAADAAIEEVTVTGSFLERPADRPQPITVIDNEALRLEQRGSIAEVFKNLPQSIGSTSMINSQQGGVNGGNSPTATINLRGLGPRATLVLLNGGRQTSDGGFGFVDRFADVLDAPQNRADAQKLRLKRIGHQTGDGGFAHARRPPQNTTVRLARLKCQTQRQALPQQMLLTDDLTQTSGS